MAILTMNPDCDWQALVLIAGRAYHVEIQAIFALVSRQIGYRQGQDTTDLLVPHLITPVPDTFLA